MRIDNEGWLVPESGDAAVKRYPTVRTSPLEVPEPLGIIWHYTGDIGSPGHAESLAKRVQTYDKKRDRAASWTVLIGRDGTLFQSASVLVGTWHVGKPGVIAGRSFANVNRATVGCELENAGRLRNIDGAWYTWPYFLNSKAPEPERKPDPKKAIDGSRAMRAPGEGFFDAFTPTQETSATKLVEALVARFGWPRDVCGYGHADFDSPRKEDPGPLWTKVVLPRVLDAVFGSDLVAANSQPAPQALKG
jgi:N-acetyl-anhydromuramyl-L-alanine amidase AmpD